jgi:FixJ family two-component response regulator|tara:strand:- start:60 stop:215 length:156 start_codon:yes stop_codon:yes gene_type:complete
MEPNYELTDDHAASHLTDKQRLAVDCIVQGFTDQEVAKEIRTARETVCRWL